MTLIDPVDPHTLPEKVSRETIEVGARRAQSYLLRRWQWIHRDRPYAICPSTGRDRLLLRPVRFVQRSTEALPQDLAEALSQLDATAPRAKEQTTAPGCGVFAATRILPTELYR